MADQEDSAEKTEEPTARKLQKARGEGQVARSQEVGHWFGILAFTVLVAILGPGLAGDLMRILLPLVEQLNSMPLENLQTKELVWSILVRVCIVLAFPMLLIVAAGLGGSLLQTGGFLWTPKKIEPKPDSLSPIKGLKKMFSVSSIAEFLKGIVKITVVALVIAVAVYPSIDLITAVGTMEPIAFLDILHDIAIRVLIGVLIIMTFVAGADYLFQKQQFTKQMRMSKTEVRDEHKQMEGDPKVKARIRQLRVERARQRMMAAVPEADVVITNPTHYAVALKYDADKMNAPKVTAKGADLIALRMRELADEHEIPLVENPPLARALYGGVEIDQEVPPEHYKAVAEVIGYVMRLKRGGSRVGPIPTAS